MQKVNIYLDNCCYNRPYDDQQQIMIRLEAEAKLFIQSEIKTGNLNLFWSYILSYENSKNNDILKKMAIEQWKKISCHIIEPNNDIDQISEKLVLLGIKEIDALHIACAINKKCDYFITTDKGILKKRFMLNEIKILNPIEFVEHYLEVRNDD